MPKLPSRTPRPTRSGTNTRLAAYALCVRDGAVLLSRLSNKTDMAGHWTLPGGGVEYGEDPATAAAREVFEECGLTVDIGEVLFISSNTGATGLSGKPAWHGVRIVFRATVVNGELRSESPGGSSDLAAWVPLDQLDTTPLVSLAAEARKLLPYPVAIDHVQLSMPHGREREAAEFYEGVLGLAEVPKPPILAARGGCWFERGAVRIHLGVEDQFQPARKAHPALVQPALDALANSLTEAGYPVRWDTSIPGLRRFHTDDAFGNRLEFVES